MSSPQQQHYISKVYLKYFTIDNKQNKNFLYCYNLYDEHRPYCQRVGTDSSLFKIKNYYSDNRFEDPYAYERIFAKDIEPFYDRIIEGVNAEKNLSEETRYQLIMWIWFSQLKSSIYRNNITRLSKWYVDTVSNMQKKTFTDKEKEGLYELIERKSKEHSLDIFKKDEIIELFHLLMVKRWRILKRNKFLPFWANDNPGFSINLHPIVAEQNPFHYTFELTSESICYFVLSPNYCIEFSPFYQSDPPEVNGMNMVIPYINSTNKEYDMIHQGVFKTAHRIIFSNSKELIDLSIRKQSFREE